MVRSQFETEICLRLKLFEIGFDFSNLRNRPLHIRTADSRSNFRKNTDKYGHLATLNVSHTAGRVPTDPTTDIGRGGGGGGGETDCAENDTHLCMMLSTL